MWDLKFIILINILCNFFTQKYIYTLINLVIEEGNNGNSVLQTKFGVKAALLWSQYILCYKNTKKSKSVLIY